jgi:threonine aldolase
MTPRDRAELDTVHDGCERFVAAWDATRKAPANMLPRLLEAVVAGERADVYGEGHLVESFEGRVADLLGAEAAVFMPSGTMAQQIALRIHADHRSSRTIAYHPTAHLELHEEKGYERLHGLSAVLVGDRTSLLTLRDLERVREPLAALLLELPQRELGGQLPPWDELQAQAAWARERGVALHLDGARLWEAAPFYGRPHAEIAQLFDSVYVSFYKALGGLAGAALAGSGDLVAEARTWRIRHGGRLASIYPYVLAARIGLDCVLPQVGAWYARAVEVGRELAALASVDVVPDPPQTPMMHLYLRGDRERLIDAALDVARERKVWLFGGLGPTPVPDVHVHELTIGEPALEVPPEEVADLFADLLERAGSQASPGSSPADAIARSASASS